MACTRFCEQPGLVHVGGTKDPDLDAVTALRPDLVVVDEEENRREDAAALEARGVSVFAFAVRSVDDAVGQSLRLAAAVDADPGALARWSPPVPPGRARAVALVPIWRRPWIGLGVGTYGSDLLARLGFANALATAAPARYPEVDLDAVRADVVLAPSEPYPFRERHVEELSVVAPVVLVDGQDLFWWGARTPAAVERLGARLAGEAGWGRHGGR